MGPLVCNIGLDSRVLSLAIHAYYNLQIASGDGLHMGILLSVRSCMGWSGGAMVLGKLPVLGRPSYLDTSRAYCACNRCTWGLFDIFTLVYRFPLLSPSQTDDQIKTEILSQRAVKLKDNQPTTSCTIMYCNYMYVFSMGKILFKPTDVTVSVSCELSQPMGNTKVNNPS